MRSSWWAVSCPLKECRHLSASTFPSGKDFWYIMFANNIVTMLYEIGSLKKTKHIHLRWPRLLVYSVQFYWFKNINIPFLPLCWEHSFFFFLQFLICGSLSIYTEVHPSKKMVGRRHFTFIVPHFVPLSSNLVDLTETFVFLFFLSGHHVFLHVYSFSVGHHFLFYLQDNPLNLWHGKGDARCLQRKISKSHLCVISAFPWDSGKCRWSPPLTLEAAFLGWVHSVDELCLRVSDPHLPVRCCTCSSQVHEQSGTTGIRSIFVLVNPVLVFKYVTELQTVTEKKKIVYIHYEKLCLVPVSNRLLCITCSPHRPPSHPTESSKAGSAAAHLYTKISKCSNAAALKDQYICISQIHYMLQSTYVLKSNG